jgi:hypothetical protein
VLDGSTTVEHQASRYRCAWRRSASRSSSGSSARGSCHAARNSRTTDLGVLLTRTECSLWRHIARARAARTRVGVSHIARPIIPVPGCHRSPAPRHRDRRYRSPGANNRERGSTAHMPCLTRAIAARYGARVLFGSARPSACAERLIWRDGWHRAFVMLDATDRRIGAHA